MIRHCELWPLYVVRGGRYEALYTFIWFESLVARCIRMSDKWCMCTAWRVWVTSDVCVGHDGVMRIYAYRCATVFRVAYYSGAHTRLRMHRLSEPWVIFCNLIGQECVDKNVKRLCTSTRGNVRNNMAVDSLWKTIPLWQWLRVDMDVATYRRNWVNVTMQIISKSIWNVIDRKIFYNSSPSTLNIAMHPATMM